MKNRFILLLYILSSYSSLFAVHPVEVLPEGRDFLLEEKIDSSRDISLDVGKKIPSEELAKREVAEAAEAADSAYGSEIANDHSEGGVLDDPQGTMREEDFPNNGTESGQLVSDFPQGNSGEESSSGVTSGGRDITLLDDRLVSTGADTANYVPTEEELEFSNRLDEQLKRYDSFIEKLARVDTSNHIDRAFEVADKIEKALVDLEKNLVAMERDGKTYEQQLKDVAEHTGDHDIAYKIDRARTKLSVALNVHRTESLNLIFEVVQERNVSTLRTTVEKLFGLTSAGEIDPRINLGSTSEEKAFRDFGKALWQDAENLEAIESLLIQERNTVFQELYDALRLLDKQKNLMGTAQWNMTENITLKNIVVALLPILKDQSVYVLQQSKALVDKAQAAYTKRNFIESLLLGDRAQNVTQSFTNIPSLLKNLYPDADPTTFADLNDLDTGSIKQQHIASGKLYIDSLGAIQGVSLENMKALDQQLESATTVEGLRDIANTIASKYAMFVENPEETQALIDVFSKEIDSLNRLIEGAANRRESAAHLVNQKNILNDVIQRAKVGLSIREKFSNYQEVFDAADALQLVKNEMQKDFTVQIDPVDAGIDAFYNLDLKTQYGRKQAKNILEVLTDRVKELNKKRLNLKRALDKFDVASNYLEESNTTLVDSLDPTLEQAARDALQQLDQVRSLAQDIVVAKMQYLSKSPDVISLIEKPFQELTDLLAGKAKDQVLDPEVVDQAAEREVSSLRKAELLEDKLSEWQTLFERTERSFFDNNLLTQESNVFDVTTKERLQKYALFKEALAQAEDIVARKTASDGVTYRSIQESAIEAINNVLLQVTEIEARPAGSTLNATAQKLLNLVEPIKSKIKVLQENVLTVPSHTENDLQSALGDYRNASPEQKDRAFERLQKIYDDQNILLSHLYKIKILAEDFSTTVKDFPYVGRSEYGADDYPSLDVKSKKFAQDIFNLINPEKVLNNSVALEELGRIVLFDLRLGTWIESADSYGLDDFNAILAQKKYDEFGFADEVDWKNIPSEVFKKIGRKWLEPMQNASSQDLSLEQLKILNQSLHQAYKKTSSINEDLFKTYRSLGTNILGSEGSYTQFLHDFDLPGGKDFKDNDQAVANSFLLTIGSNVGRLTQELGESIKSYKSYLEFKQGEMRDIVKMLESLENPASLDLRNATIQDLESRIVELETAAESVFEGRNVVALGQTEDTARTLNITLEQHLVRSQLEYEASQLEYFVEAKNGSLSEEDYVASLQGTLEALNSITEPDFEGFDWQTQHELMLLRDSRTVIKLIVDRIGGDLPELYQNINMLFEDEKVQSVLQNFTPEQKNDMYLEYLFGPEEEGFDDFSDEDKPFFGQGAIVGLLGRATIYQSANSVLQMDSGSAMVKNVPLLESGVEPLKKELQEALSIIDELNQAQSDPRVKEYRPQIQKALKDLGQLPSRLQKWKLINKK
jgi:hypothetical protein